MARRGAPSPWAQGPPLPSPWSPAPRAPPAPATRCFPSSPNPALLTLTIPPTPLVEEALGVHGVVVAPRQGRETLRGVKPGWQAARPLLPLQAPPPPPKLRTPWLPSHHPPLHLPPLPPPAPAGGARGVANHARGTLPLDMVWRGARYPWTPPQAWRTSGSPLGPPWGTSPPPPWTTPTVRRTCLKVPTTPPVILASTSTPGSVAGSHSLVFVCV